MQTHAHAPSCRAPLPSWFSFSFLCPHLFPYLFPYASLPIPPTPPHPLLCPTTQRTFPKRSTVLKYRFLDTYDGIVEPYGEMHLTPLSFANYSSFDYKFTVCADSQSGKSTACKHGDLWAGEL